VTRFARIAAGGLVAASIGLAVASSSRPWGDSLAFVHSAGGPIHVRSSAPGPSGGRAADAAPPDIDAYRGLGTWVDVYDDAW
jgi:hypothetical protein